MRSADDRTAGGHVLEGRFAGADVAIQYLRDFDLRLPPHNNPFDSADLEPAACDP